MNTKIIHSIILMLLLSLTAHEVHAVVVHDVETCDECIHFQSNDGAVEGISPQYTLFDLAFHLKIKGQQNPLKPAFQQNADFIRGPPIFSYVVYL